MSDDPKVLGGRYRLGRRIGHGGMAEVYLATDERLHRTVAVKVLRTDLARDDSFQERFRREAQSAAGLNHPTIVAVYDTGEEHQVDHRGHEVTIPYIVMEYVEGRTLREFIHEGRPMETRQAAEIMSGVLSALEYSHEAGIVHRDIKPGNIMITDTGQVKVMDFGIARAVADATSAMTQTQAVMGTAQYLSPEQARGQLVDARSDIYSAACVLYEMLTGRPPFTGDSPVSIAYQHVREDPVPPSTFNPALSPQWDAVILKGLTKDREDRYPSAVAFSRDIAAVVSGRTPPYASGAIAAGAAAAAGAAGASGAHADATDPQATTVLGPVGAGATSVMPAAGAAQTHRGTPSAPAGEGPATGTGTATGTAAEEDGSRRPLWLFALVGLALVAVAAALLLYYRPWASTDTVAVPDVTADTLTQAQSELKAAGLEVSITEKDSTDIDKDSVIGTDPTAGTEVDKGSTVTVIVSTGPAQNEVPDLSGMSLEEARTAVEKLGLKLSEAGTENSASVDKGKVVRSDPEAGTTIEAGETVMVYTATGQVDVPGVVGKTEKEATSAIEKAGLKAETTTRESSDAEAGTVIEQNPTGGSADKGSTVQIVVAKELGPVSVPNVEGATDADAAKRLSDAGLGVDRKYEYSDSVPEGSVIRTDPAARKEVKRDSKVTLIISRGPQPTTEQPTTTAPTSEEPTPSEDTGDEGDGDGGTDGDQDNG